MLRTLAAWEPRPEVVEGEVLEAWTQRPEVVLLRTRRLHLECEPLESALAGAGIRPDAAVFLSKHKAQSGRPSLTVHPVGNFAEARFGGKPGRLSPAAPGLQTELLRALQRRVAARGYPAEVTFEVTHHGPLVSLPACFIELGSSEAEWRDPEGARVVAEAVLDVASRPIPALPVLAGLGGGHYAPRFTEAALTRRVHFAHLVPAYAAQAAPDVGRAVGELVRASPSLQGVYLHRGTLDKDAETKWSRALAEHKVSIVESVSEFATAGPAPPA